MRDYSTLKTVTIRNYEVSFFPSSIRTLIFSLTDLAMALAILATIQEVGSYVPLWSPIWLMMKAYYVAMNAGSIIHSLTNKEDKQ